MVADLVDVEHAEIVTEHAFSVAEIHLLQEIHTYEYLLQHISFILNKWLGGLVC